MTKSTFQKVAFTKTVLRDIARFKPPKSYFATGAGAHANINIRLMPSGNHTWYFSFSFNGNNQKMKLGKFHDYDIDDICELVRKHRRVLASGRNPKTVKTTLTSKFPHTVGDVMDAYYIALANKKAKTTHRIKALLEANIGDYRNVYVSDVTETNFGKVIAKIPETSPTVRAQFQAFMHTAFNCAMNWHKHGIHTDRDFDFDIPKNPLSRKNDSIYTKDTNTPSFRDRTLSFQEIHDLVNSPYLNSLSKIKLKLVILLGQRLEQIFAAPMKEIDFKKKTWTWDYDKKTQQWRMKVKKKHTIPLTDFQIETIRETYRLCGHGSEYLFPRRPACKDKIALKDRKTPAIPTLTPSLSGPLLNHIRSSGCEPFQARDFRRTFKSRGVDLGIPRSALDAVQHHQGKLTVADKHYDHHDTMPEMKYAMKVWSDKLEEVFDPDWVDDTVIEVDFGMKKIG